MYRTTLISLPQLSIQVFGAPEANCAAPVQARPHQQELGREAPLARAAVHIPIGAASGKERAAPNNAKTCPSVGALAFGPLPDVATKIVTTEGRAAQGECLHWRGPA